MDITYYSVFDYASDGINIRFPDIPPCLSCASTYEEAVFMAQDALALYLHGIEPHDLPTPNSLDEIELSANEKAVKISVNMQIVNGRLFDPEVQEL